jgi:hypothetical protein
MEQPISIPCAPAPPKWRPWRLRPIGFAARTFSPAEARRAAATRPSSRSAAKVGQAIAAFAALADKLDLLATELARPWVEAGSTTELGANHLHASSGFCNGRAAIGALVSTNTNSDSTDCESLTHR